MLQISLCPFGRVAKPLVSVGPDEATPGSLFCGGSGLHSTDGKVKCEVPPLVCVREEGISAYPAGLVQPMCTAPDV